MGPIFLHTGALMAGPFASVLAFINPFAFSRVLGFSTAGDAANGLLFGWDIATLQQWALIYLGLSSLAFVVVWVVGYLRRG